MTNRPLYAVPEQRTAESVDQATGPSESAELVARHLDDLAGLVDAALSIENQRHQHVVQTLTTVSRALGGMHVELDELANEIRRNQ